MTTWFNTVIHQDNVIAANVIDQDNVIAVNVIEVKLCEKEAEVVMVWKEKAKNEPKTAILATFSLITDFFILV